MRIISLCFVLMAPAFGWAQQVLFSEDFEGATPAVALNTTDVGSIAGGANDWLVNNVYLGGDGLADCLGIEIPFTIPTTPGQPAGISSANGSYLHTASTQAINSGVTNCSFGAADGFCTDPGDHFVRMSTDVSTLGQSAVTLSFWWICQGGSANYGEVYYSTDGGTNWVLVSVPIAQYRNSSAWSEQVVSLPAFAEQATLRFGFRFVNGTSLFGAADPGFGIDDIRIISDEPTVATLDLGALSLFGQCEGASFDVPYVATGSYTPTNTFTVELSDATGSFALPTVIGSLNSTTSGTIQCQLPGGVVGTGFRIRVASSDPALVTLPNSSDINISAQPNAGQDASLEVCTGQTPFPLFPLLGGAPDVCGSWFTPDDQAFDGTFDPAFDPAGVYRYITNCPGSCPQDSAQVTISIGTGASAGNDVIQAICSNDVSFSPYSAIDGGVTTGQFFYQGQPFPLPDFSEAGSYSLQYVVGGIADCPADTALFQFDVILAANAGNSLSYTTCITAPEVDLFDLLGNAQEGGTWLGPTGAQFTGILDPGTGASGLYTYIVTGTAPCADDQSTVALVIDPCVGVGEHASSELGVEWRGQEGATHILQIGSGAVLKGLEVVDMSGRRVRSGSIRSASGRVLLDMEGHGSGKFLVIVTTDRGSRVVPMVHLSR